MPAEILPDEPLPIYLAGKLEGLSLSNLNALFDAYQAAFRTLQDIANQPRISGCRDRRASNLLEDEATRFSIMSGEIVEEAKLRTPSNRDDADFRARLIVTWGIERGDGWPEIALLAIADLVATMEAANA